MIAHLIYSIIFATIAICVYSAQLLDLYSVLIIGFALLQMIASILSARKIFIGHLIASICSLMVAIFSVIYIINVLKGDIHGGTGPDANPMAGIWYIAIAIGAILAAINLVFILIFVGILKNHQLTSR